MNRAYHKGRPYAVPQSAKDAWATIKRRDLTAPLARHLGLSKAAVSKWRHVPEDRLDAVAAYLLVDRRVLRPDLPNPPSIYDTTPLIDLTKSTLHT